MLLKAEGPENSSNHTSVLWGDLFNQLITITICKLFRQTLIISNLKLTLETAAYLSN